MTKEGPQYQSINTTFHHSLDPLNSRCLLPLIPIDVVESGAWERIVKTELNFLKSINENRLG
jgi:hypothetical protein